MNSPNKLTFKIDYKNNTFLISSKYREGGKNLLFFIHGLGCAKEVFDHIWDIPEFRDFSVLCFDLPGFGDSSKNENFSYKMSDQAEICRTLLDNFNFNKIHIAAHSMGGAVGLLLYDSVKSRLGSFNNIEGNLFPSDCMISRKISKSSYKENHNDFFHKRDVLLDKKMNSMLLWAGWIKKSSPLAMKRSSADLVSTTDSLILLKKFKAIDCPRCYIYGEKNRDTIPLEMIKEIPLIPISKSGHFPMIDNPQEFYSKLFSQMKRS